MTTSGTKETMPPSVLESEAASLDTHVVARVRVSAPSVYKVADKPLQTPSSAQRDALTANAFDFPATLAGSTANFHVYYNPSLGQQGLALANDVLAVVEADRNRLSALFGGISAGPFNIIISPGIGGAYHYGCSATDLYCDSGSASWTRFLVIAEEVEVFEAAQNRGWNCGWSNGEGLSRVLAQLFYPGNDTEASSAATWLDGGRPDWIDNDDHTDTNAISYGCVNLFLNYLHSQLGFGWDQIVQAAADPPSGVYTNLTRSLDAFGNFTADLALRFPVGHPSGVSSDNPFPVPTAVRKNILADTAVREISAVDFNGRVFISWCGTDLQHHLNVESSGHRTVWSGKVTLGDTSPTGVSLCVFNNRLYMAWSGTGNGLVNVMSSSDGVHWSGKVTLNETSGSRPALGVYNGRLVLGWVGTDGPRHLNLLSSTDGVHWINKHTIGEEATGAPAFTTFQNRLYMAWTGTDSHVNIDYTLDYGATLQGKVTLGETSFDGPALVAFGNQLLLAWTGVDSGHHLNVLRSTDGSHWGSKITYGEESGTGCSLGLCYGQPALLWTGTDSHLNLMSI